MKLTSVNPATGGEIRVYDCLTSGEVDLKIKASQRAQSEWKNLPFKERGRAWKSVAQVLNSKKQDLARLMAEEMGKPLKQGESEIEKCVWVCNFYADEAEHYLKDTLVKTEAKKSYVHYEPLGIILAVMPWNFPFWQVFRGAAPALMAGNGMVLKHASGVSGCAVAIQNIFNESLVPDELFANLLIPVDMVEGVIRHPGIAAVTLTGSTPAGKAVASQAGSVLKKCVLELGGSDAYLILEDADLEDAAKQCAASRMINTGQSCVAAKRFIVVQSVKKRFEELFAAEMAKFVWKDPFDPKATAGPLARLDLRDKLHDQVQQSIAQGARVILGGVKPQGIGAFYPPTVLTDVRKGMTAYEEETFGPVASIIEAKDEADAIRIANDSEFGLGSAVFTKDRNRGERIAAEELQAGCAFVNSFVKSDPRLPFGGIKESGFGRELGSWGIHEFVNAKTVYVQ